MVPEDSTCWKTDLRQRANGYLRFGASQRLAQASSSDLTPCFSPCWVWAAKKAEVQPEDADGGPWLLPGSNSLSAWFLPSYCGSNFFRPWSAMQLPPAVSWHLCKHISLPAATTNYHRLSGLNSRNLSFHNSTGWKSDIKVSTGPCFPWQCKGEPTRCLSPSSWWFASSIWHSLT